jgi:hypothetical protein
MFHQNVGTHLQYHNPEDFNMNLDHCGNLKYQKGYYFLVKQSDINCEEITFGEWGKILYLLEDM